ncbi:MAG: ASCH domain-containing protein [Cytophagales bacterium]|nr:ASCH domain-containing protein [Rhizobacter sp.]
MNLKYVAFFRNLNLGWLNCPDELADLVLSGTKQATASLAIEFTSLGEALPSVGDVSIILRGDSTPAAIIERVAVEQLPFKQVDAAFAAREGEGDGTLAWWREAHRGYFQRVCQRLGGQFDDNTPVICQSFKLVCKRT